MFGGWERNFEEVSEKVVLCGIFGYTPDFLVTHLVFVYALTELFARKELTDSRDNFRLSFFRFIGAFIVQIVAQHRHLVFV